MAKKKKKSDWNAIDKAMKNQKHNPNKMGGAVAKLVMKLMSKKIVVPLVIFGIYCAIVGLVKNIGWAIDFFKWLF